MINPRPKTSPAPAIKLDDVYYALFRQKWLILSFFTLGLTAAAILFVTTRPVYRSNASILIRYISESASLEEVSEGTRVKSPDYGGRNIMNSELEILTSFDLAQEVADTVGADKILGQAGGAASRAMAGVVISKNLRIEVPRLSNVIKLSFAHANPEVAQKVLGELINSYVKRHRKIHLELGIHDELLKQQRDRFKGEIATADAQIESLRLKAGGLSTEEAKAGYVQEITRIRQEIWLAEAELAQRNRLRGDSKEPTAAPAEGTSTNAPAVPDLTQRYKNVLSLINALRARELDAAVRFKDDSPILGGLRQQIAEAENVKRQLEAQNPSLATIEIPVAGAGSNAPTLASAASEGALMIKTNVLHSQLKVLGEEVAKLDSLELQILEWQRKRALAETNLWSYASALEQAQIMGALGPGKVSNITSVQQPSPPFKDPSGLIKLLAGAVAGSLFGGIALALLIELGLKRTLRRPGDIEARLGQPLFISVPAFSRNGQQKGRRTWFRRKKRKPAPSTSVTTEPVPPEALLPPVSQAVQPYCEGLRDRLLTFFRNRNMTHKPKLVAVTSCSHAAGVTTIATGLAASLSETGDSNVLLVDMNVPGSGTGHPFYQGKKGCGLLEAIEGGSKGVSPIQEKLYLVSAGGAGNAKEFAVVPQRFNSLLPRLKATDFEYIIFDMPPISQTSPTVGLAPFFDMVLTVVESEKTQRDLARNAMALLESSNANVATVLNRKHNYLPRWLHEEL